MGYSEMWCLACGGPCVIPDLDSLETNYEFEDEESEKYKLKRVINFIKNNSFDWLFDWVLLTSTEIYTGHPNDESPSMLTELYKLNEKQMA